MRKSKVGASSRRIGIIVPPDVYDKFSKQFAWGERNRVLVKVIEWISDKVDKYGRDAIYLLLRGGDLDKIAKIGDTKDGDNR